MVVLLKQGATKEKTQAFLQWAKDLGLETHMSVGENTTLVGLVGDTTRLDIDIVRGISIVEQVKRIQEPYKAVNRKMHPENTHVKVGSLSIGEGTFTVMAGPCSVESQQQMLEVAHSVKTSGAGMLRGGAFKPRTSPYAFQGLGEQGFAYMKKAREETGLPLVSEVMSASQLQYLEDVDMLQVGARNMQNFELLKELGRQNIPVLLKRGLSATLEELLMSAEYIMAGGNENIIFCERGIRTFETATRNTLDISAIPFLKSRSHLPVIVDPSHAAGNRWMLPALSRAAVAAGADGLMIEVHNNPEKAWSDGAQSLTPNDFQQLMEEIIPLTKLMNKQLQTVE